MLIKNILTSVSDSYDFEGKDEVIFLNTGDVSEGKILHNNYTNISILPGQAKKSIMNYDLLYSEIRPINRHYALVNVNNPEKYVVSTKLMVLRKKSGDYDINYLYQFLISNKVINNLQSIAESRSGTFPQITYEILSMLEVPDISISEQQHIVNILGTIDDKIENNESLIAKINESTKLFYISFCNNGFVDEVLESYIENYDRQRKPLSSRERDFLEKIYPYYGATEVLDYVDNYLFDGDYLLMGEDGTVADSLGFPIVQRVNEKFWANNHTHILKAKNGIDNNVLELILKNTNVQSIITGAVQPKINQANMNSLKIKVPNDVEKLMKTIVPYFEKRQSLIDENKKLNKLKQLYLKKFFN